MRNYKGWFTREKEREIPKMSETTESQRAITYFDISIAGIPAGRVIFQLYNDLVPKTAENFRQSLSLSLVGSLISYR